MMRVAVSILLARGRESKEVLLVDRNPELVFFGGYQAFPGGTLEPEDATVPVENLPRSVENSGDGQGGDFSSFVAAAARELFEETGVWLGRGSDRSPGSLEENRRRMLAGEVSFLEILKEKGQHIDAADFTPLCRITTPPFTPRRYDTWFLQCRLPAGARVDILDGELVGGGFTRPEDALTRWRRGEVLIVPPVIIFLQELQRSSNEDFVQWIRQFTGSYDRGKLHRVYFTPGVLLAALKTPTQPPATHTNTCLVGEEWVYVVDPAPVDPAEQNKLWHLLDEFIAEGRTLKGILLTHYHPDHVGAVAECQRRYKLPIHAHRDTVSELPGFDFGDPLEHGQELDLGTSPDGQPGWKLRAYHVPGHAPGHLAFEESRYKALLLGDLLSTLSSILIDPRDGHLVTYLESLRFLESVAEGTVYPGHGPPAREGKKAIQAQIRHRQDREDQLLAALTDEPQSVAELVEKVYTDVDKSMWELAGRSLVSGLIKLQEEGRVEETDDGYRLTR
jgi:glyoxylase-like metal-dependent hydrolase (beta-lactamase superfamily II)/8-oxo-dGTP pyrophosphatase MutT (NUDIX family)